MTRCDEFYRKFGREGNFCKKYPSTAKRISKFMVLREEIAEEASKSELLNGEDGPNVNEILSEGASRPLASIKTEESHKRAITMIVQCFEQKFMNDAEPLSLTYREVQQIVREIVPPKASKASKDKFKMIKTKLDAALKDEIPDEAIDPTIVKIDDIISALQQSKQSLVQRKAALNRTGNTIECPQREEGELA
jgi:hypothetical protein